MAKTSVELFGKTYVTKEGDIYLRTFDDNGLKDAWVYEADEATDINQLDANKTKLSVLGLLGATPTDRLEAQAYNTTTKNFVYVVYYVTSIKFVSDGKYEVVLLKESSPL